jgi:hypothetical protein
MEGAVGVVLYAELSSRSGGSLSLWRSEADLRRFVALPRHVEIVRRYRDRVTVRAATWTAEAAAIDIDATLAARAGVLTTGRANVL